MANDKIGSLISYSRVSHSMQDNVDFKSLTRHQKLIWYHIICARTLCTGVVNQSVFNVALYNEYVNLKAPEKIADGVTFVKEIFDKLSLMKWIQYDETAELIFLPWRIKTDLPPNYNVLIARLRSLRQVPKSIIRISWIRHMRRNVVREFGENDIRSLVMIDLEKAVDNEIETNGVTEEGDVVHSEPLSNLNELLEEAQKLYRGESKEKVKTKPVSNKKKEKEKKKFKKESVPPEGKSKRWYEMWNAITTAEFYVPGRGVQTAWESVKDPEDLCDTLAGPGYPGVDPIKIFQLADWTKANKSRSKRDIRRYLINNFAKVQDNPRGRNQYQNNSEPEKKPVRHKEMKADNDNSRFKPSEELAELCKIEIQGTLTEEQKARLEELRNGDK